MAEVRSGSSEVRGGAPALVRPSRRAHATGRERRVANPLRHPATTLAGRTHVTVHEPLQGGDTHDHTSALRGARTRSRRSASSGPRAAATTRTPTPPTASTTAATAATTPGATDAPLRASRPRTGSGGTETTAAGGATSDGATSSSASRSTPAVVVTARSTTRPRPAPTGRRPSSASPSTSSRPTSDEDRRPNLESLTDNGNNPVIAVGFLFSDVLADGRRGQPGHPVRHRRRLRRPVVRRTSLNLGFAEQEGSFLVGVAAALKTETDHIGFIGGQEIDLIKKLRGRLRGGRQGRQPGHRDRVAVPRRRR